MKEVTPMSKDEIHFVVDYFCDADPDYLRGMGADKSLLPAKNDWTNFLESQILLDNRDKQFFYLIWWLNGKPIGHTNINKIRYGKEANMHLHIWYPEYRKSGIAIEFFQIALPIYFEEFKLERLIC